MSEPQRIGTIIDQHRYRLCPQLRGREPTRKGKSEMDKLIDQLNEIARNVVRVPSDRLVIREAIDRLRLKDAEAEELRTKVGQLCSQIEELNRR